MNTATITETSTTTNPEFILRSDDQIQIVDAQPDTNNDVREAVEGYVEALRRLGRPRVNSLAVSVALGISEREAIEALRELGLQVCRRR